MLLPRPFLEEINDSANAEHQHKQSNHAPSDHLLQLTLDPKGIRIDILAISLPLSHRQTLDVPAQFMEIVGYIHCLWIFQVLIECDGDNMPIGVVISTIGRLLQNVEQSTDIVVMFGVKVQSIASVVW